MGMYFASNNNFVCNIPTVMEHIDVPVKTHTKSHHWYDFLTDWTGENLWHNLVMIGELALGVGLSVFTGGASAAAAGAEVAATAAAASASAISTALTAAATATGIGLIGAAANTGINAAYGHASWQGFGVNAGFAVAGGVFAGGLKIGKYAIKGVRAGAGSGIKAFIESNPYTNNQFFDKAWYARSFKMNVKWAFGNDKLLTRGFASSKEGMKYIYENQRRFFLKLAGQLEGKVSKVGPGTISDMFKDKVAQLDRYFDKGRLLEKGIEEPLQRTGNYNSQESLEEAEARLNLKYKGIQGGALEEGLGSSYGGVAAIFQKLSTGEIDEVFARKLLQQLPRSEQLVFNKTWNGFLMGAEGAKPVNEYFEVQAAREIVEDELSDFWRETRAAIRAENNQWELQKLSAKQVRRMGRIAQNKAKRQAAREELERLNSEPWLKRETRVLREDWKNLRKAEGWRNKFESFKKLTSSHDFNKIVVQGGQLINPTDFEREVAKFGYLRIRRLIAKLFAKSSIKKAAEKVAKVGNIFKKFLMAGGTHVFPGSTWILGYKVLTKVGNENFIEIRFQPGPSNHKQPVFTWATDFMLERWKTFISPGHFYLRYFAKGLHGSRNVLFKVVNSAVPLGMLRNLISITSNITHTISGSTNGKFITGWSPKNVLKGIERSAINRSGWILGDVAGMFGGRIFKGIVRKMSRYGIIPLATGKPQHWSKVATTTVLNEARRKARRGYSGSTSFVTGHRIAGVFANIPSAVSGGMIKRSRGLYAINRPRRRKRR